MASSTTEGLAGLQQQRNLLEQLIPMMEQLAELQGENPTHTISLNGHGGARKKGIKLHQRRIGRPKKKAKGPHWTQRPENKARIRRHLLKIRAGKNKRRVTGPQQRTNPIRHAEGERTSDMILKVIKAAKRPIPYKEVMTRMQAAGWKTNSPAPLSVVQASAFQLRKDKQIKRFGDRSTGYTFGLPTWDAAAKVAAAFAKSQTK